MLSKIKIENFRGIKKCEINNLGKVNVLIGKNNSGKSSILDALCLAKCLFNGHLFDEPILQLLLRRKGIERSVYTLRSFWHNYNTQGNIRIELGFKENISFNFEVRWGADDRLRMYLEEPSHTLPSLIENKYVLVREVLLSGGFLSHSGESSESVTRKYPQVHRFLHELTLIDDYLARKLERLETNVFSRILEPRLDKDLVRFLNEIYGLNAEGLTYIPLSPSLRGHFVLAITAPKASIHIDELGDGAKYAATILSLCLLLENSALLIEELESHQHAGAITKLLPYLAQISEEKNVQLFITTHSFEVIQTLSSLSDKFDIRFFHVQRNEEGDVFVELLPSVEAKVLLDLGIDLRYLDIYKKFIVVEGKDDTVFIRSLLEKYGRNIDEVGHLVEAGNKNEVIRVSVSLLSARKDILALIDYDNKKEEELLESLSNTIKNRQHKVEIQQRNVLKVDDNITVTLIPMGLPNDIELKNAGITWHEMEDYCLKLVEIDGKVKEWAGVTVKELVDGGKKAGFEGVNKSSTALSVLALRKELPREKVIMEIIKRADQKILEEMMPPTLKEVIVP